MNRRTRRNLLYWISATILALSVMILIASFIVLPPELDLANVRQGRSQASSSSQPALDLDFSGLLEKRLQGPAPAPPIIEPVESEIKESPPPVAPVVPPDFTLTNLYVGPNASIASFSKGGDLIESGSIGELVFGAEILEFDVEGKRVKVQFRNEPHWLLLK